MPAPISQAAELLGQRVKARRQKLGATQEQVADYSGIDVTTVRKIELGLRNPNLHNIVRIASTLGIDPGTLLKNLKGDMVPGKEHGPSPFDRMSEIRRNHGIAGN